MATSQRNGEESQIWTNRFGQLTITQAALAASGRNCKDEPSQAASSSCVEQTGLHRHQSGGHREGTEDISVQGKLTHCWLVNC